MTEFSRIIELDRIPRGGSFEKIAAEAAECAAVKDILKVPDVHSLNALLNVLPVQGGGIKVTGEIKVDLTLQSVISLDEFRTKETFSVERYFVKRLDVSEENVDVDVLKGRTIDLGDMIVETIGLELDPYPRKPGEAFESAEPEDSEPARVTPFNKLSALKNKP